MSGIKEKMKLLLNVLSAIGDIMVRMIRCKCNRCGHHWIPRKDGIPVICPKCKSPYWENRTDKIKKTMKLTDYNKGYLESAIDFEGSLTIVKVKNNAYSHGYEIVPQGYITNTNKELLENVKSILGDGSIILHQKYRNDKNWKPAYKYRFTRKTMRWLLPKLKLIEKERQRLLVIRALELIKQGGKYCRSNKMSDEKYNELCEMVEIIRTYNNRGLNANWNRDRGR